MTGSSSSLSPADNLTTFVMEIVPDAWDLRREYE